MTDMILRDYSHRWNVLFRSSILLFLLFLIQEIIVYFIIPLNREISLRHGPVYLRLATITILMISIESFAYWMRKNCKNKVEAFLERYQLPSELLTIIVPRQGRSMRENIDKVLQMSKSNKLGAGLKLKEDISSADDLARIVEKSLKNKKKRTQFIIFTTILLSLFSFIQHILGLFTNISIQTRGPDFWRTFYMDYIQFTRSISILISSYILISLLIVSLFLLLKGIIEFTSRLGLIFEILDVELKVLDDDNYMGLREISQFYTYAFFAYIPLSALFLVNYIITIVTIATVVIEGYQIYQFSLIGLALLIFIIILFTVGQRKIGSVMEKNKEEKILPLSNYINKEIKNLKKIESNLSQLNSEQEINLEELNRHIYLREKILGVNNSPINTRLIVIVFVQIVGGIVALLISILNFFI